MNNFMTVVFSEEKKAFDGVTALHKLHDDGSITLYAVTVVERKPDGTLSIKRRSDEGPIGMGIGTLIGALFGLLGGPVGLAIGASAGAVAGAAGDVIEGGISEDFLATVKKELTPGKFAVVAELSETWVAPVDVRMGELGGTVMRQPREDYVAGQINQRVAAVRNEREQRKQARADAKAEKLAAKLDDGLAAAERDLHEEVDQARRRLDETKEQVEAKLRALQVKAAGATPEVRKRIEQQISETRRDLVEREQQLSRAFQLAEQAIHA